jgi:hypothetical protein
VHYRVPSPEDAHRLIERRLAAFAGDAMDWSAIAAAVDALSYAEIAAACDAAIKTTILDGGDRVPTETLVTALAERRNQHDTA